MTPLKLDMGGKSRATRAIASVHEIYTRKGGILEIETRLDDERQTCASVIYALAQYASWKHAKMPQATAEFAALCDYAETTYKEARGITKLSEALPPWASYKSHILRAMRLNLDPADFDSERALRNAMSEIVRPVDDSPQPVEFNDVRDWLSASTMSPRSRNLLTDLVVAVAYVKTGQRRLAEGVLQTAIKALAALVNPDRAEDPVTQQALRETMEAMGAVH